jgi:hypothetical protein
MKRAHRLVMTVLATLVAACAAVLLLLPSHAAAFSAD